MKFSLTTILIAFLFYLDLNAQNTLIIHDQESNKPLEGANVVNHDNQNIFITDKNGKVVDLEVGNTFRISFIGYISKEYQLTEGMNIVYLEPDYQMLNNLTVIGYDNKRKLGDLAGSYAITSRFNIERFNDESLVRSMNTIPGIRFEERSPSSYRISIRGNLLRAPFGVRNVKVYWNNIPYTDPTGNTPLNLMDLNNIGKVETIKGPA